MLSFVLSLLCSPKPRSLSLVGRSLLYSQLLPFQLCIILLNVKGYLSHKPPNSSFHFIMKWCFWGVFTIQASHSSINATDIRLKHLINAKFTIALGSMLSLRGLWRIFWETSSSLVILLTLSLTTGFSAYLGKKTWVSTHLFRLLEAKTHFLRTKMKVKHLVMFQNVLSQKNCVWNAKNWAKTCRQVWGAFDQYYRWKCKK